MADLRYTLRFLWTHKAFAAAAVLTLAVGLGANTALYGVLNVALRPLAIPDADQLMSIAAETEGDESGGFQYTFSTDALADMQQRTQSFSDVVGVMPRIGGFATAGRAAQFFFVAVSDNFFSGLGIQPQLGELFARPSGSPAAVVLGHSFWMKHFGGDPGVIGRHVRINGHPAVVSGVVPRSFHGTFLAVELDGYVTLDDLGVVEPDVKPWLYHNRKARPVQVFGRLKPVRNRERRGPRDERHPGRSRPGTPGHGRWRQRACRARAVRTAAAVAGGHGGDSARSLLLPGRRRRWSCCSPA